MTVSLSSQCPNLPRQLNSITRGESPPLLGGVMEKYTIVNTKTQKHYDTYEQKFLDENRERTYDTKKYLKSIIKNYPEKFRDCKIESIEGEEI